MSSTHSEYRFDPGLGRETARSRRPTRRRPWVACLAFLPGVVAAGCATPFEAREQITLTAPLPVDKLVVENRIGDVEVRGDSDATEVRADVVKIGRGSTPEEARKAVDEIQPTLGPRGSDAGVIHADGTIPLQSPSRRYQVRWRITVPPRTAVEVETKMGDVTVAASTAEQPFTGPVRVETSMGDVNASRIAGGLTVRTSMGDIRAEAGGALDLRTQMGDVELRVLPENPADIVVRTAMGEVDLLLPPDRPGRVTAETDMGDLDLRPEGVNLRMVRLRRHHFEAELNGATEPTLEVSTQMGDVTLRIAPSRTGDMSAGPASSPN